jgi:hypothetical protein
LEKKKGLKENFCAGKRPPKIDGVDMAFFAAVIPSHAKQTSMTTIDAN